LVRDKGKGVVTPALKHHIIKMYEEMEVKLQIFLTLALDQGEQSATLFKTQVT
jgi:hypothetical protein